MTDVPTERRGGSRRKVLQTGTISYYNDRCTMPCLVFEMSKSGARLKPNDAMALPHMFRLRLAYGPSYDCEIVRRWRDQVGVRFL